MPCGFVELTLEPPLPAATIRSWGEAGTLRTGRRDGRDRLERQLRRSGETGSFGRLFEAGALRDWRIGLVLAF